MCLRPNRSFGSVASLLLAFGAAAMSGGCGGDVSNPDTPVLRLASIIIDGGGRSLERGSVLTLTATARDTGNKVVSVPFAWRSTADSVVAFGPDGKLTARDTGVATVTASALGVTSGSIQIHVVWEGPAKVAAVAFNPPVAVSPGGSLADSIRVAVTTLNGNPAVGARVAFAVKSGGGTVSPATPALVTVGPNGIAAAKWTVGSAAAQNVVTATVVGQDSTAISWVKDNPATFTVSAYNALVLVAGDAQSGSILSSLPVVPSIRLVDASGKPRAAVPVTFSPTGNGRVANGVVSTAADGSASPGVWTLGDATGDQQLIVTVEAAKIVLHATATGTSVRFSAPQVTTTQTASCTLAGDQIASCFGSPPQIGTGDTTKSRSAPTATKGGIHFATIVGTGGAAHFCGTATDLSIYCWGINAFVDTTGLTTTTYVPTRLQSNIAWLQVSPGGQHNCALANDGSAYCWGIGAAGQLGTGDTSTSRKNTPTAVFGGFKFNSIASGASHSCGITTDGTAVCWGLNANGQIGDGTATTRLSPTRVSGALHWKSLGAGSSWTCGLTQDNIAYCWGGNAPAAVPTSYPTAPAFASISVGAAHACALASDGRAYCWGDNTSAQLGDSTTTSRATPTLVSTSLRFSSISAGFQHTCGVTTDGFVACWGRNTVGELGFATPSLQLTPRYVVIGVTP